MGLTISYTLKTHQNLSENVLLVLVEQTASLARKIGCPQVWGPAFGGPFHWKMWELPDGAWTGEPYSALEGYSVSVLPGEGSEHASFGLCRYENVPGWTLSACCKTQYAARHGIDHFLLCHRRVISLLDLWRDFGVQLDVCDEGQYWESRSTDRLRQKLETYDRLVAAVAGAINDEADGIDPKIAAAIFDDARYEWLEAEGREGFASQLAEVKDVLARLRQS